MQLILELAYKGTNYHGWQIQKNAFTVQEALNIALSTILKTNVETFGSGRTDTGVHAEQQFVQLIQPQIEEIKEFNAAKLLFKLNAILPKDIVVIQLYKADNNFSVRHDAILRSYEYRISFKKNPFLDNLSCFYFGNKLNINVMNEAIEILKNNTDFQSFSKYHTDVANFECQIFEAYFEHKKDILIFHISANRFLRGMVRAIVGTLLEVGKNKVSIPEFEKIIEAKDRKSAKFAAPPQGLFLTKVKYRDNDLLPLI